ncbi:MAG: HINT domain-containing protein [Planctomycetes bacterium]|nr:HINT domain-containing protein [Planctomycetota bacterium]
MLAQDETGEAVPVAIETVEAGDLVWSRCDKTGEEGFQVVVETYIRETNELVHLSYRTEGSNSEDTLTGTAEHPFWSLTADDWVDMGFPKETPLKVAQQPREEGRRDA